MAKFVADNYAITINGTNYSTSLASVELSIEADDVETTAFGGSGYRTRIGGLKAANISLEFHQDFASGALDSVLFPLLNTLATVVIMPIGSTVGTANPSYTCTALVNSYTPHASAVGDLATVSVSWPVSGTVTRATA